MRIISKKKLQEFWKKHHDAEKPLLIWYEATKREIWQNLNETRQTFPHADAVCECTVFNIKGNNYRLITHINYKHQIVYTLHVLTHAEYDTNRWKDDCNC